MKKYLILITILCLLVTPSFAGDKVKAAILAKSRATVPSGVTFDAVSSYATTADTTLTWSHTVSGSDRYLFVGADGRGTAGRVTGVTYNGTALTNLWEISAASTYYSSAWGLKAPDTGTHNIVITYTSTESYAVGIGLSLTGVNQTTATGTAVTSAAYGTAPSVNVSSGTGELVIDMLLSNEIDPTVGSGQTERASLQTVSGRYHSLSTEPGSSTTTMSWTVGEAWYAYGAVGIKPK